MFLFHFFLSCRVYFFKNHDFCLPYSSDSVKFLRKHSVHIFWRFKIFTKLRMFLLKKRWASAITSHSTENSWIFMQTTKLFIYQFDKRICERKKMALNFELTLFIYRKHWYFTIIELNLKWLQCNEMLFVWKPVI